jgi:hypothetical protein
VLAELLERRGTEEALAEARTLRDGVAQQLARHEARRAAALEETRAAAAEAVRQWREERIKARGRRRGARARASKEGQEEGEEGQGQGARGRRLLRRSRGGETAARASRGGGGGGRQRWRGLQLQRLSSRLQWGSHSRKRREREEEAREECAICLQDLELEDDEDPWVRRGRRGGGACGAEVRASLPRDLWGHVVRQVRGQGLGCDMSEMSSTVCGSRSTRADESCDHGPMMSKSSE